MRFHHCALLRLLAASARPADDFKPLDHGKDRSGWHVKDAAPGATVSQ